MELSSITYTGPVYDGKSEIENQIPENLLSLLKQVNGFIQYGGALHVRGLCVEPEWHSIENVMGGELAIHNLFNQVKDGDIPFAQDCVADQYLLREGQVYKLQSETGEIDSLNIELATLFFRGSG